MNEKRGSVMIIGGGIAGTQAALDLAESGLKVYLVEQKPSIGGIMAQLDKTFPTNDCAMCIMAPKLVEVGRHRNVEILTLADVEGISGTPGHFRVNINRRARYVDEEKCNGCGLCMNNCPVRNQIWFIPDEEREKIELAAEDRTVMEEILNRHRARQGNIMLILQDVNEKYNYFPEKILKFISRELDLPLSLVYRIATFYNAFSLKPRGRHTISVCMGTTCYVRGADRILNHLSETLEIPPEETTRDARFTLKSVRCLGCCSIAPVISIDGKTYGRLKSREIPLILKEYA